MSDSVVLEEKVLKDIVTINPDIDDLVTVFIGDLHNCRERLHELAEEKIPSIIVAYSDVVNEVGPPVLQLQVRREDLEDVADVFAEIWEEVLDTEGLDTSRSDVVDLSQDTITCPGCGSEVSELTEDGECPECGLFLGLPEEREAARS